MVIQNLEHSYIVVQACPGAGTARQFLCREERDGQWLEKKLLRVPLEAVSGNLIRFLAEQIRRESFTDLEDYFTDDAFLYAVMQLGAGKPLSEKLSEEKCSLTERLEIGRHLLERLVLLDPAPYFFCAAMDVSRIRTDAALESTFDYDLSELPEYAKISFDMGAERLCGVMDQLFPEERKQRSMPELERFCYGLSHGEYADLLSILQAYNEVCAVWLNRTEAELTPQTLGFKLWALFKKLLRVLRKLALIGILLLALLYLGLSVWEFAKPPEAGQTFSRIGTLEIETTAGGAEAADSGQ